MNSKNKTGKLPRVTVTCAAFLPPPRGKPALLAAGTLTGDVYLFQALDFPLVFLVYFVPFALRMCRRCRRPARSLATCTSFRRLTCSVLFLHLLKEMRRRCLAAGTLTGDVYLFSAALNLPLVSSAFYWACI